MIKTSKNGVKNPDLTRKFCRWSQCFSGPRMMVRAGIFPETSTVFEVVEQTRKLYPNEEEFMVCEVEDLR